MLGIECVGEIESAPGGEYEKGQRLQNGPVWTFDQLRDAHATMDANTAGGKMVVLLP